MARPSTMKEVANEAGVAMSTVSHVINKTATVSPATQQKVLQAIEKLNYTPNALARGLRQKHTKTIGIILPDIANEFYAACVSGFLDSADSIESSVFISHTGYQLKREETYVQSLIEKRVDGIVFFGGYHDDILQRAKAANINIVLGDRFHPDFPTIEFDNSVAINELIERLTKNGVTRIGYISEPLLMPNVQKRYEVFIKSMKEFGVEINQDWLIFDEKLRTNKIKQAQLVTENWLKTHLQKTLPQVFITSSDLIAIGAIETFKNHGFAVPEDIGFTGIDNSLSSQYSSPRLTTIEQQAHLLGRSCFTLLEELMHDKNKEIVHQSLDCKLVIRDSVKQLVSK